MMDLIVSVPDHCLSFYFDYVPHDTDKLQNSTLQGERKCFLA